MKYPDTHLGPISMEGMSPVDAALEAVATVFEVLGRCLVCLDRTFQVVHASPSLDLLAGEGAVEAVLGRSGEEVLGAHLCEPGAPFRKALEAGERREGWGTTIRIPGRVPRLVSVTGAPLITKRPKACDPRVLYLLVLRPHEEEEELKSGRGPTLFSGMLARSPSMLRLFRLVENLSGSEATVLISGESGTGKELVARAIHAHSPRAGGPLVAVNCGAIPPDLLESELFGHVRGAFTGAVRDREGRFEAANGGTLFLDEVGDLPLPLQVNLLRVLQEGTYERVGESSSRNTDARIIAATNQDLFQAVQDGRFRDDLYYRLRVVPLEIAPLRERREDIEPLTRHLLARANERHGRALTLSPGALRRLLAHTWPGNVRELENVIEYAVVVCRERNILEQDLPAELLGGAAAPPPESAPAPAGREPDTKPAPLTEKDRLLAALQSTGWKREEAARALGMSRTTLWRRMRELGINR